MSEPFFVVGYVSVCMCVCVCARARARVCVCVCVCWLHYLKCVASDYLISSMWHQIISTKISGMKFNTKIISLHPHTHSSFVGNLRQSSTGLSHGENQFRGSHPKREHAVQDDPQARIAAFGCPGSESSFGENYRERRRLKPSGSGSGVTSSDH